MAVLAVGVAFAAGWATGRSPGPRRPTAPPALAGGSVTSVSRSHVAAGDRITSGDAGDLWTTGAAPVRITDVEGLHEDGIELRHVMLVERSEDNPGFLGPTAANLQAEVDAQVGARHVRLRPAERAVLACCGTAYDVYLDARITSHGAAGSLAGVRLRWRSADGRSGRTDAVMPISFCAGDPSEPACTAVEDRLARALRGARP